MPSLPIILIDRMSASGQVWWIRPAMKVPWPKNGSIRPCSGSIRFGVVLAAADVVGHARCRRCARSASAGPPAPPRRTGTTDGRPPRCPGPPPPAAGPLLPRSGGRPSQLTGIRPPEPGTAYSLGPAPWPKLNPCPKLNPGQAEAVAEAEPLTARLGGEHQVVQPDLDGASHRPRAAPGSPARRPAADRDRRPSTRRASRITPGEEVRARFRAWPRSDGSATSCTLLARAEPAGSAGSR